MRRVPSYVLENFCILLRKRCARTVLSRVYFLLLLVYYFEPLDPEILTNNTHNIFYFKLLDPEILTNNTQNIFGENMDHFNIFWRQSYSHALLSRVTPKDRKMS